LSTDYSHLQAATRALADESAEVRIARIRNDRWITYPRAEAALARLQDLLTHPKRTRMPNLLLFGQTNNGKSMIVQKFWRDHPALPAHTTESGLAHVPVLKVQMPAGPDEARFFGAILDELGAPLMPSAQVCRRQEATLRLLRETRVELIICDEVHNLLSGSPLQQRRLLNLLRWLGNELQIPLIAVGTVEALRAIQSDDQLANRFEPFHLPHWTDGDAYRQLLRTLEAVLPLRLPSQLAKPALATKILSAAEGILGEVVSIVTHAAVHAVTSGAEAISAKLIDEIGFIPPSERRRVARLR
jgi:hypothetical protein